MCNASGAAAQCESEPPGHPGRTANGLRLSLTQATSNHHRNVSAMHWQCTKTSGNRFLRCRMCNAASPAGRWSPRCTCAQSAAMHGELCNLLFLLVASPAQVCTLASVASHRRAQQGKTRVSGVATTLGVEVVYAIAHKLAEEVAFLFPFRKSVISNQRRCRHATSCALQQSSSDRDAWLRRYCTAGCQKRDWAGHKAHCKVYRESGETMVREPGKTALFHQKFFRYILRVRPPARKQKYRLFMHVPFNALSQLALLVGSAESSTHALRRMRLLRGEPARITRMRVSGHIHHCMSMLP